MMNRLRAVTVRQWMIGCLFNFLVVALLGLLMRAKFIFSIPWFDQKFIMHAHSHFAFSGWVSQALMLFMVMAVFKLGSKSILPLKYQFVLWLNLLFSVGMLITFAVSGYSLISIVCSSITVLISYVYVVFIWRDLSRAVLPSGVTLIFKGALFFSVLSSIGTYVLAYLKIIQSADALKQLASIYFYLHFQYNGWFLLACLGLVVLWIYRETGKVVLSDRMSKLFVTSVFPTYFLSVLWWKEFPDWLFYTLVFFVILQIIIWGKFLLHILNMRLCLVNKISSIFSKWLWIFVLLALCVKILLQTISVIPALSQLAYGFRPIVIAYLHLVLLGIISITLLGYGLNMKIFVKNKYVSGAGFGVLCSVLLNEILLTVQGIGGLAGLYFQHTNEGLFFAAFLMVCSITVLLISQCERIFKELSKKVS